jgi:hypothetical protein
MGFSDGQDDGGVVRHRNADLLPDDVGVSFHM